MCPADDHFVSGANDRSVRLWNLQSRRSLAYLQLPPGSGAPIVAYDPSGRVFAATYTSGNAHHIKMYDARNFDTGPFETFTFEDHEITSFLVERLDLVLGIEQAQAAWLGLVFSPDGDHIIVTTKAGVILVLDAFEGVLVKAFCGRQADEGACGRGMRAFVHRPHNRTRKRTHLFIH